MKPAEACAAWIRVLRAVAKGEMDAKEALARIPEVDGDSGVPSTFWSARDLLEQEVEFGSEEPVMQAHFRGRMEKLADRLEGHLKSGAM